MKLGTSRIQRRLLLAAAGLVSILSVAFAARSGSGGIARAERRDIVRELVAPAEVEPASERVELGFDTAARIAVVLVSEGDPVVEGQLLARLDDRLARAMVARAEASVRAARH